MNLSNDTLKMEIVSRLVKEGHIDFNEALKLLELEKDFLQIPITYPSKGLPPWPDPLLPLYPITYHATNP
jgi:hypothetical protein